jgi:hypothetical protein
MNILSKKRQELSNLIDHNYALSVLKNDDKKLTEYIKSIKKETK